jgi:isopentenyldiphosphate isomerase
MKKAIRYGMVCVVTNEKGQILLLKRSPDKKLFPNKWFVVSAGPLNKNDDMRAIALREIKDELGVQGQIIKEGKSARTSFGDEEWIIAPFLVKLKTGQIKLNEEHTEWRWIFPQEIDNFVTVPQTKSFVESLLLKSP